MRTLVDALLSGLDDYTIDERGDVGSWIRIACIQGLTTISELFFGIAQSIPDFESYFPPQTFRAIAAGLLKQGVERLDNVRQTAGTCFTRLLKVPLPNISEADRWLLPSLPLLNELFLWVIWIDLENADGLLCCFLLGNLISRDGTMDPGYFLVLCAFWRWPNIASRY